MSALLFGRARAAVDGLAPPRKSLKPEAGCSPVLGVLWVRMLDSSGFSGGGRRLILECRFSARTQPRLALLAGVNMQAIAMEAFSPMLVLSLRSIWYRYMQHDMMDWVGVRHRPTALLSPSPHILCTSPRSE